MPMIDRYEMSIPGHMRLVDARSALNYLERFVQNSEGPIDGAILAEKMEPLVEALNDAADETRPVDGRDAFERQAADWRFIKLSPREEALLHTVRTTQKEGQELVYQMILDTYDRMPMP